MARKRLYHPQAGFYKTRLAPTPSGFLHLGNAFSFALTASLAFRSGSKLMLRIDDMDSVRAKPEFVKDIFRTLEFLEIDWDEGPEDPDELDRLYSQQLRMPLYEKALDQLRSGGHVFACICNRSELPTGTGYPGTCRDKKIPLDAPGACWRLKTDAKEPISYNDYAAGVTSATLPASMNDFVVRKKDGFPSYQLTSVVDDTFFNIDFIVRGEDLIPSTMGQLLLCRRLNYEGFPDAAFFFHLLLADEKGKKLSKSNKDLSVATMINNKISPEEVYFMIGQTIGAEPQLKSWHILAEHVLNSRQ